MELILMEFSKQKKWLIVFSVLAAAFLLMNFSYLAANLKYDFSPSPDFNAGVTGNQKTLKPNMLFIPSLNILAPVIYIDKKTETAYQAALKNGVVHYPGTAAPGQFGNVYIFGHSSDFLWSNGKYKSIFAVLPKIQKGAVINITDQAGVQYTYLVTGTAVVGPNDLSVLDQKKYTKQLLTLQTSWPVGTALKRFVVYAEIKKSVQ